MQSTAGRGNGRRASMTAQPEHEEAHVMVAPCAVCTHSDLYKELIIDCLCKVHRPPDLLVGRMTRAPGNFFVVDITLIFNYF